MEAEREEAARAGLPEECRGPWGSGGEEQHLQTAAFPQGFPEVEAEVWALHPDKVSAAQHPPAAPPSCPGSPATGRKTKKFKKGGKNHLFSLSLQKRARCCVRDRQCPCALGLPILRAAAFSTFSTWRVALLRVIGIILHEKIQHEGSKCAAIREPCPQELTWIKSAMVFPPGTVFILSSFK